MHWHVVLQKLGLGTGLIGLCEMHFLLDEEASHLVGEGRVAGRGASVLGLVESGSRNQGKIVVGYGDLRLLLLWSLWARNRGGRGRIGLGIDGVTSRHGGVIVVEDFWSGFKGIGWRQLRSSPAIGGRLAAGTIVRVEDGGS